MNLNKQISFSRFGFTLCLFWMWVLGIILGLSLAKVI